MLVRQRGILALAFALAASPASAGQTFTFIVPVEVQNIADEVEKVLIRCWVRDKDGYLVSTTLAGIKTLARTHKGPAKVTISLEDDVDPQRVKAWECELLLSPTFFSHDAKTPRAPNTCGDLDWFYCAKPGTLFKAKITGRF